MKHKKLPACYDGQRRTVRLGKLIKSGGAGSVYFLADDPSRVAKLYHPQTDTAYYQRKLSAMLAQGKVEQALSGLNSLWGKLSILQRLMVQDLLGGYGYAYQGG